MSSILTAYASTSATTITITLAGLAAGSARQSAVIDNSSSESLDALVRVKTFGTSNSTLTLDVYAYGAAESTTPVYTDGATGSDAAFTGTPLNSVLVGQVAMNAAASVTAGPWGIASAFGGTLPPKWGLIVVNSSGGALDATAGNHSVVYQGVYGLSQ